MVLWSAIQLDYFSLPGIPIQMGDGRDDSYYFYNYYIFLDRIMIESNRFQSIFLEPGYLGTMLALMLYANKFNWHSWYNWILLAGLVFSQSLAGYATFAIGYLLYQGVQGFSIMKYVVPLFFLSLFVYSMQYYNNGDNYINHNILERLTDESNDKYIFKGSIRTDDYTSQIFHDAFSSGDLLFGINKDLPIDGAGYRIFFLQKGIISALLYFFAYRGMALMTQNRKYSLFFLLLIVITFWQAAYPFSYSWIIPFLLGILLDNRNFNLQSNAA